MNNATNTAIFTTTRDGFRYIDTVSESGRVVSEVWGRDGREWVDETSAREEGRSLNLDSVAKARAMSGWVQVSEAHAGNLRETKGL